jgi:hypothetical protein
METAHGICRKAQDRNTKGISGHHLEGVPKVNRFGTPKGDRGMGIKPGCAFSDFMT